MDAPAEPPRGVLWASDLDLSEAADKALLTLAVRRAGETQEEVPQDAAAQAQLVAAGGRQAGHGAALALSRAFGGPEPQWEGRPIPKWAPGSVGTLDLRHDHVCCQGVRSACFWGLPTTRVASPGPSHPSSSGVSQQRTPHSASPHHTMAVPVGDSIGRTGTHRWTQPPASCWPQRAIHLASLVGGTRRGRGLCLELVSAGEGDTGLEREDHPQQSRVLGPGASKTPCGHRHLQPASTG